MRNRCRGLVRCYAWSDDDSTHLVGAWRHTSSVPALRFGTRRFRSQRVCSAANRGRSFLEGPGVNTFLRLASGALVGTSYLVFAPAGRAQAVVRSIGAPEHAPRWSPNLNDSSLPVVIRRSGSATRKCASRKARVVHREAKLGRAHANLRAARTDHFHSMSPLAQRRHFLHCTNFPTARSVKSPVDPP
jgi:hypothetical protein